MGNMTATPKGKMKLMPMGGIQDENGDYVMESFVIRACNNHAALVEALDKFIDLCPRVNDDDPISPALAEAWLEARAALKLAKEPQP